VSGLAIGKIATSETFMVNDVSGAPKGETGGAQVVGDVVFVARYDGEKSDWWVYRDNVVKAFVGGSDIDVPFLVTDGARVVWKQGSQPYLDANSKKQFARYDLYWSPYSSDAAGLTPRILVPDIPPSLGNFAFQNGYVAGNYLTHHSPDTTAAIVVRSSDGVAWRSILAEGYNWGRQVFPASDELWGTATKTPNFQYGQSAVRVPYASMAVIQTGFPDGAAEPSD
jgi:hypothetical protein